MSIREQRKRAIFLHWRERGNESCWEIAQKKRSRKEMNRANSHELLMFGKTWRYDKKKCLRRLRKSKWLSSKRWLVSAFFFLFVLQIVFRGPDCTPFLSHKCIIKYIAAFQSARPKKKKREREREEKRMHHLSAPNRAISASIESSNRAMQKHSSIVRFVTFSHLQLAH